MGTAPPPGAGLAGGGGRCGCSGAHGVRPEVTHTMLSLFTDHGQPQATQEHVLWEGAADVVQCVGCVPAPPEVIRGGAHVCWGVVSAAIRGGDGAKPGGDPDDQGRLGRESVGRQHPGRGPRGATGPAASICVTRTLQPFPLPLRLHE